MYVDEAKPEPTSGYSEKFGLWINRPFHIQSRLASGKYLQRLSNNMAVTKTPNGRDE
jgi:hypothetical protein